MLIKQFSSIKAIPFYMVDSSDHISGKTGLTPTVILSKNGSAFAAPAGTVSEIGSGWYKVSGHSTDSNTLGAILIHATATGADPFDIEHEVVALDVDSVSDPWNVALPGSYVAGTAGYILGINLDVAVSTRSTYAGTDTPGTTDLLTRIPGPITVTSGKVDVNDKTGFSLTSAYDAAKTAASQASVNTIDDFVDTEVAAIKVVTDKLDTALQVDGPVWQYTANALEFAPTGGGAGADPWLTLLPGSYAAGTAGKILGTNLDAAVSTRATQTSVDGIAAKTSNLPSDPADASDIAASFATVNAKLDTNASYVDTEVAAIKAKTDMLPADPADASDIATQFASVGAQLTAIDDYVDTEVSAIKAKTDQMTFTGGKIDANATTTITPTDLNAIADALLKRDWNSVTGEAQYSALNAFRMLRNAWNTTGGTLTVKKEDGVANAWTRSLGTDPAAQPIISAT